MSCPFDTAGSVGKGQLMRDGTSFFRKRAGSVLLKERPDAGASKHKSVQLLYRRSASAARHDFPDPDIQHS